MVTATHSQTNCGTKYRTKPTPQTPAKQKKFITLTYTSKLSEKIANKFRKTNYNVAFRTKNKLKYSTSKNIRPQNKHDNPGVYKLKCSDCEKFYIGQTGRSFTQRYSEHIKSITQSTDSAFANHILETGHTYSNINHNLEILHTQTKGRHLNTLEQYEIYRHSKTQTTDILNEQTNFKSNILFEHILTNLQIQKTPPTSTSIYLFNFEYNTPQRQRRTLQTLMMAGQLSRKSFVSVSFQQNL